MRGVLLIIDGLGDLPVDTLDGKTPLEAARTPVMDRLASAGRYGLVDPIGLHETPNTHSGCGLLLGMMPDQADRLHRGPVEAAGQGVHLSTGDVALRTNFATLSAEGENFLVVDRRAGRICEGTEALADGLRDVDLGDGVKARLVTTDQHRGVLILSGGALDSAVTNTDPGDGSMPAALRTCRATRPAAKLTAEKINRFIQLSHETLENHPINQQRKAAGLLPANGIITRGAGTVLELDNIVHHHGMRAAVVAGCNTVRGLGKLFGFDVVYDSRFTGDLETDLDAKIATAIEQLDDHELVFMHIKAPDICAHDQLPLVKRDFLERLDASLHPLEALDAVIAIGADHTTDSNSGLHTADPVPVFLSRPGSHGTQTSLNFGESACRAGNLPRQTGHQFLMEFIRSVREL